MQLNLADPPYGRLAELAVRFSRLLAHGTTKTDRAVTGTLDEFLGALYGLSLAQTQGFVERPVGIDIEIKVLQDRSDKLARGDVRIDGKWMAGFHFNCGLLRLSAVYDRSLKTVTGNVGKKIDIPHLLAELDKPALFPTWAGGSVWSRTNIVRVHKEVNDFKHTAQGLNAGRDVPYAVAVDAAEELLVLLEKWPSLT
jgi:hypothetical protein